MLSIVYFRNFVRKLESLNFCVEFTVTHNNKKLLLTLKNIVCTNILVFWNMKLYSVLLAAFCSALILLSSSCSSNKRALTYFSNVDTVSDVPIGDYVVKIEPADELFITINSLVPNASAAYNLPLSNPAVSGNLTNVTQASQQTYIVDTKGDIDMPILGKIHVAGKTTEQICEEITELVSKDVTDPVVKVELVNFVVNVAGEVLRPGRYPVASTRFSLLDALSAAGDLTPYGKRDNVLIVREENGKRISARLNLNSAEALSSPFFFLKQNDYIYVEPSHIRKDNADYNQNNSFKLSVVSTIVSGCSVIASLIIALSRL